MNRIDQLFAEKQRDILNVYFTAGHPNLEDTGKIILSLEAAGADLVEVGMPYSDPLADGPTIQSSGQTALANGMTLPHLLQQIRAVRQKTNTPLILMGYFNQVMQYGEARFFQDCKAAGIDGVILPDLPLHEYEQTYRSMVMEHDLSISFLITPQTSEARIRKIDELTRGFIYMVSSASITGAKSGITGEQIAYFERINAMQLKHPRLIGFGISNSETFQTACQYANGAIIGSAFIKALEAGKENVEAATKAFVEEVLA